MKTLKRNPFLLMPALLAFFLACSTEQSSGGNTPVNPSEAGTNIGNPTVIFSDITFELDDTIIMTGDNSGGLRQGKGGEFHTRGTNDVCVLDKSTLEFGARTQACLLDGESYGLGVYAIHLISCVDSSGETVLCSDESVAEVKDRAVLYEGDLVKIEISKNTVSFPEKLNEVSSDVLESVTWTGLQFIVGYQELTLPSPGSEQAAYVAPYLAGKKIHMCGIPEGLDSAMTVESCVQPDARRGDFQMDVDGDLLQAYMDINDAGTALQETKPRPADYQYLQYQVANGLNVFLSSRQNKRLEFTNASIFSHEGVFAPIMSFAEPVSFEGGEGFRIHVSFNITKTFKFKDGSTAGRKPDAHTCLTDLSLMPCPFGDSDPLTPGVFDPVYDEVFMVTPPGVLAEVIEE